MFFGCSPCCGKCDPAFLPSTISLATSLAVAHPGTVYFGPPWLSNRTAPQFTANEVVSAQRLLDVICHRHGVSINAGWSVLDAINAPSFSESLQFSSTTTVNGRVAVVYSGQSSEVSHTETMSGFSGSDFAEMTVSYSTRTTATVTLEETLYNKSPCWRLASGSLSSLLCDTSATISVSHDANGYSYYDSMSFGQERIRNFLRAQDLHGLAGSDPGIFPLDFSGGVTVSSDRPYVLGGATLVDPPTFSASYTLTFNQ